MFIILNFILLFLKNKKNDTEYYIKQYMKYIFLWDIYGRPWRAVVKKLLPKYIDKYKPDFIFANTENLSNWRWIKLAHLDELQKIWITAFTWGNHIFSNHEIYEEFKKHKRQLRPANYPEQVVWNWYLLINKSSSTWSGIFQKLTNIHEKLTLSREWHDCLLINVMWNVFMKENLACPFEAVNKILEKFKHNNNLEIIIDIHAEASSEKRAIAEFLDWRASMVVWTHTHVQTNDEKILSKWTWFITDLWMCWPYDSVLWVKKDFVINNFMTQIKWKHEIAEWPCEFSWVFFEIKNGKCIKIEKIYEIDK